MEKVYKRIRHKVSRWYKSFDRGVISIWMMNKKKIYANVSAIIYEMNLNADYAICKWEQRLDSNFPDKFVIPTEIDILTRANNVVSCADLIEKCAKTQFNMGGYEIKRIEEVTQRVGIILYFHHREIFYFDIQTAMQFSLSSTFNSDCIQERVLSSNQKCYYTAPQYDILIRATEFIKSNHKLWHKQYIYENVDYIDNKIIDIAFEGKSKDLRIKVEQLFDDAQHGREQEK